MKKDLREDVTYSNVYNYFFTNIGKENFLKILLKDLLKDTKDVHKNSRNLYWVTKHLIKIKSTQRIGNKISSDDLNKISKIHRLSTISNNLKIRTIQHKIIENLYRPDSKLFNNDKMNILNYIPIIE